MSYAELQVTTHFSFLRGASSAQELFETGVDGPPEFYVRRCVPDQQDL